MDYKKVVVSLLLVSLCFIALPQPASAASFSAEIQAKINTLILQVLNLKLQLASLIASDPILINPDQVATSTIAGISPTSTTVGGPTFTLTVNGTNFIPASKIACSTVSAIYQQETTYVSSTRLTTIISPGSCNVVVINPAPGGGTSNAVALTVNNPVPTITRLLEDEKLVGSPGFYLYIFGTNFTATSIVRWNNTDLGTGYFSPTELRRWIPESNLLNLGRFNIAVFNPTPGGGVSNSVAFTIENPVPHIVSISPDVAEVGRQTLAFTIVGTRFVQDSRIRLDWIPDHKYPAYIPTRYISPTELRGVAKASYFEAPIILDVSVDNNAVPPSDPHRSNIVKFPVSFTLLSIVQNTIGGDDTFLFQISGAETLTPSIRTSRGTGSSEPTLVAAGNYDITETVPIGWTLSSVYCTNGTAPTGIPKIPDDFLVGVENVTVTPGRTTTCTFSNTKNSPDLTITSITPEEVEVGSPDLILTIDGSKFQPNSTVMVNGLLGLGGSAGPLTPRFVSSTQLSVVIPAASFESINTLRILVVNSAADVRSPEISNGVSLDVEPGDSLTSNLTPATSKSILITRFLGVTDTGIDVVHLQTFLEDWEYLKLPPRVSKGYFGAITKMGVAKFQQTHNISPIGLVGPKTLSAINTIIREKYGGLQTGLMPPSCQSCELPSLPPSTPLMNGSNDSLKSNSSSSFISTPTNVACSDPDPLPASCTRDRGNAAWLKCWADTSSAVDFGITSVLASCGLNDNSCDIPDSRIANDAAFCNLSTSLRDKISCAMGRVRRGLSAGVCRHYARCTKKILGVMGVSQTYVGGSISVGNFLTGTNRLHAWNQVAQGNSTWYIDSYNNILFSCTN